MSSRLENDVMTGVGLKFGSTASQPVETDATISQLPPATTGAMTTPDGRSRSVVRCMWQDHVAADFVTANNLRKSGDLKGSFKTGFLAALKAIGALVATVFGTIAAGVVWWKEAPKAWGRSKTVEDLTDQLERDRGGELSVSASRTQQGLPTVDENGVPGDEGDDERSSVGSAAELQERNAAELTEDGQLSTDTVVVHEADQAMISVATADVSGSAVAVAQPGKKALKAAAKAAKQAEERVSALRELAGFVKPASMGKLKGEGSSDVEALPAAAPKAVSDSYKRAQKEMPGLVAKIFTRFAAASKANAGQRSKAAHDAGVEATKLVKDLSNALTQGAASVEEVLALHGSLIAEIAKQKGDRIYVHFQEIKPYDQYPTFGDTLLDGVMAGKFGEALAERLTTDLVVQFAGSPEQAARNAVGILNKAVRVGYLDQDCLADVFADLLTNKFAADLATMSPEKAQAALIAGFGVAVQNDLMNEEEVAFYLARIQQTPEIQKLLVQSAVVALTKANAGGSPEELAAVLADDANKGRNNNVLGSHREDFVQAVTAQIAAIREGQAKTLLDAVVLLQRKVRAFLAKKHLNERIAAKKKAAAEEAAKARALQEAAQAHAIDQARILAEFDAQMKPVEAAQEDLQKQIDLLAASLERQDQLNLDLERIASTKVQIPVVNIVNGAVQPNGMQGYKVTEALGQIDLLRGLVLGDDSPIPKSKQGAEWKKVDQAAVKAATEAGTQYSAKLQEVTELTDTIDQQRQAVWQSLEAVQKLIATYGAYHAAKIGNLDAEKQPTVIQRLERVNAQLKAQTQIISQIGVESDVDEEQPVVLVQSAASSKFATLFGADDADDSLFSAQRQRATSVFVPAGQVDLGNLPGRTSPALSSVGDKHPLAADRQGTPVAALQQEQPSRVASPGLVVLNVAEDAQRDAVFVGRAQTPTLAATKPVEKPVVGSRSLTSSPVAVNAALWDRKPVAVQPVRAEDDESEVGSIEDFQSAQGDISADARVDGDVDLLAEDEAEEDVAPGDGYDSDDAGSNLNSRTGSPLGKPDDVQLPDDEE